MCNALKGDYLRLNNYFLKYWKNTEIFNFTNKDNSIIINRTNNIVESFHSKLNKQISHFHPKLSFLVSELKKITKLYYDKYINSLHKVNIIENEKNFIVNDIINFIKNFVKNNKVNLDVETISKFLKDEGENFYNLMIKILEILGIFNDNIIDNIINVFIKNKILISEDNENIIEGEDRDENIKEEEDSDICSKEEEMSGSTNLNINSNIKSVVKKNNQSLKGCDLYLLNGDDVLEDNIEKNKKRKKINYLILIIY